MKQDFSNDPGVEQKVDDMLRINGDEKGLDEVVDDIVVSESDEALALHDARLAADNQSEKLTRRQRVKAFFAAWWHHKPARYITLAVLLLGLIALGAIPDSRYAVLNTAGVRSTASLQIIDTTTELPLKNVNVALGDKQAKTGQNGVVKLSQVKLGRQKLQISQIGFAPVSQTITLGLGSNPLGNFKLKAVGQQFHYKLVDYVSGKALSSAEISSGESSAKASASGLVVLTVGQGNDSQTAVVKAAGYRNESVKLADQTVTMVPSQKEVFVSKQSGKYDVYSVDIDGHNRKTLLAASGQEDENISLVANDDGSQVALVSRRDTVRDQDGYQLQTLTIIDVGSGDTLTLDRSEQLQIVGWDSDRLVYMKVKAGTSAGNPERYQLISYDYEVAKRLQLAGANYFSGIVMAGSTVYYAASNDYQGGDSQLVAIGTDTTNKQVLVDRTDIWSITRTSYDGLTMTALNTNYTYKFGDDKAVQVSAGNYPENRYYLDATDGKRALWVDQRDGKGVLLLHTTTDKSLLSDNGVTSPLRWLNPRTVIYRVVRPGETADYVLSLDGGQPHKITDLTNTIGNGPLYR